jgi:hypothetical protein
MGLAKTPSFIAVLAELALERNRYRGGYPRQRQGRQVIITG